MRLVGDAALACAFVSYCGPFNQQFRKKILNEYFYTECVDRSISVTKGLDVNKFLVDDSTVAEWPHTWGVTALSDYLLSDNWRVRLLRSELLSELCGSDSSAAELCRGGRAV